MLGNLSVCHQPVQQPAVRPDMLQMRSGEQRPVLSRTVCFVLIRARGRLPLPSSRQLPALEQDVPAAKRPAAPLEYTLCLAGGADIVEEHQGHRWGWRRHQDH